MSDDGTTRIFEEGNQCPFNGESCRLRYLEHTVNKDFRWSRISFCVYRSTISMVNTGPISRCRWWCDPETIFMMQQQLLTKFGDKPVINSGVSTAIWCIYRDTEVKSTKLNWSPRGDRLASTIPETRLSLNIVAVSSHSLRSPVANFDTLAWYPSVPHANCVVLCSCYVLV